MKKSDLFRGVFSGNVQSISQKKTKILKEISIVKQCVNRNLQLNSQLFINYLYNKPQVKNKEIFPIFVFLQV